jgi:hypothetical protein
LGSPDPVVQIADDIRKLREDFHRIATGFTKPKVDIFTSDDRRQERDRLMKLRSQREERASRWAKFWSALVGYFIKA